MSVIGFGAGKTNSIRYSIMETHHHPLAFPSQICNIVAVSRPGLELQHCWPLNIKYVAILIEICEMTWELRKGNNMKIVKSGSI